MTRVFISIIDRVEDFKLLDYSSAALTDIGYKMRRIAS